ncbi:MAG: MFS superfamily sulfate permease-like transporter [Bacteroidia bacterium]|jgi:MFS superfamily sulfate permease-like transporter
MSKEFDLKFLGKDLSSSIVVFLVALPLCLGISLVSEAPLISGLIAGIVGGIVVGSISGSRLGVSGPAAGLAVIVADSIKDIGSFEVFLAAVVIAGIIQVILGFAGAGKVAFYFPSSVIKGMLAAIGISIILKQIPHAIGVDKDPEGDFKFFQTDGETTFSELLNIENYVPGALIIGVICLIILIFWESKWIKGNKILSLIPGPLLAVAAGIGLNQWYPEALTITKEHLVRIPEIGSFSGLSEYLIHPKLASFAKFKVIKVGIVIAIIASLETLLSAEATDRLDPRKNITPTDRELKAQGFGNIISGLIGGIPVTQVIVRSSANVQAGGRTKLSAILHGFLLFGSVMLIPNLLNLIPLSALAAILLVIGFKLAKPSMFKRLYQEGQDQFVPFVVTIVAVLFTDLLVGILIGLLVGIGYVLFTNFRSAIVLEKKDRHMIIHFKKDVFFYNRAELMKLFGQLKEGDELTLDGTKVDFIDHDIFLAIQDFVIMAERKDIKVNVVEITRKKITFINQKDSTTHLNGN